MIIIDLGNIWNMLSALGTIGAVIVSLWLAYKKNKGKIYVVASYDISWNRSPSMTISKNTYNYFRIVDIGYIYRFKKYSLSKEHFFVTKMDGHEVYHSVPFNFFEESALQIVFENDQFMRVNNKKIKYYMKDIEGRIYRSRKFKFIEKDKMELY